MAASLIILVLVGLGNIVLGLIVLLQNRKSRVNIAFFLFTLAISCWTVFNFLTDNTQNLALSLWSARLSNFFSFVAVLMMWLFTGYFVYGGHKRMRHRGLLAIIPLIITLTPVGIKDVTSVTDVANQVIGPAYYVVIVAFVGVFIGFVTDLIRGLRRETNTQRHKNLKLILVGSAGAFIFGITSQVVLPLVTSAWWVSKFGPLFTLILVTTITVGIVKYRLFDIRMAVTRLIGYTITIGLVAVFYSGIVYLLTSIVSLERVGFRDIVIMLLPAIFVGFTFHYVEAFVSRHTQRIFYKDAYDLRQVLNKLSDALLAENDIDKMMHESLRIISGALKPGGAYLAVINGSGVIYKHISIDLKDSPSIIEAIISLMPGEKQVLVDRHEDMDGPMSKILAKEGFDILLRLGPHNKPMGLLLLGPKKSGTNYNKQDISLLQISAKNLGIALDNAKKYEQILHFADTMHQEVKKATSRLRAANKELKNLDALKDDFIATASHQLRTPSASVHDALVMLNHPKLSAKDRQELIGLAEASSEHLVTVVKTMLNMARIESGRFGIDKSEADLVLLTEKVIGQVKILADQRGSIIAFTKPVGPIIAEVDVAKINEAVSNYIENAIKYSPQNSTISVSLMRASDRIIFETTDQGIGVPEIERPNLFGKFYRASNARQDQPEGNGIGLYVVRCIAEGHGGQAYYRPGDNGGSVFGFWLPV